MPLLHIIPKSYERLSNHLRIPVFCHFGWPLAGDFVFGGWQVAKVVEAILKYMVKRRPGVGSDIKKPECKESCYDQVPVAAAHALTRLLKVTREGLTRVRVPALIIASREDHVVKEPVNAEHIMANLGSKNKELLWLENSYHVATLDNDAELIFGQAGSFIEKQIKR